MVFEPAFYRSKGLVFIHLDRYGIGERIMLPLAADGENGDGILGATIYNQQGGAPDNLLQEAESWFDL